jgi:O-antigen/teichoic acid export membrane protein
LFLQHTSLVLRSRLAQPPVFALLLSTTILTSSAFARTLYLRAAKTEPTVALNVVLAILTATATVLLSRPFGSVGLATAHFCINGVVGLSLVTYIFRREKHRRRLPAAALLCPVPE